MTDSREIDLPLGQSGLVIEGEQDPSATGKKALVNAADGSLKHAVNVDYQGRRNLHRRLGYHDVFNLPADGGSAYYDHKIVDGATPLTNTHTWLQTSTHTFGIRGLDRYTYMDNRQTKQTFGYDEERYTVFAQRYIPEDMMQLTFDHIITAPADGAVLTQAGTLATMTVLLTGVDPISGVEYILGFDLDTGTGWDTAGVVTGSTFSATTAVPTSLVITQIEASLTATWHWRNVGTPNIRILDVAPLDRLVWDLNVADAFSDVNRASMDRSRFWQYQQWGLLGEQETFLIGSYGGHYTAPHVAIPPRAWNCGGGGLEPDAGSFDTPYINEDALQRRCLVWWPDWYDRWSDANDYAPPTTADDDVGTYHWYAPFVWYYNPYNPNINLKLTFAILNINPNVSPAAGSTLTQAVSGATMVVVEVDNDTSVLHVDALTVAPLVGDTITDQVTANSLVVTETNLAGRTITGLNQWTGTGLWGLNAIASDDAGGTAMAPVNPNIDEYYNENRTVRGHDLNTGDWDMIAGHTVNDGGVAMSPANVDVESIEHIDYDQFYAEPCGAFLEEYHECMFMAKIERTVLIGSGYQTIGTPTFMFSPNEVMYSFPGYASAIQMGTSTSPPQYPMAVPNEPNERVWGCSSPDGYRLNRIAYAEPRGTGVITGMTKWNEMLYIMKPQGFTVVTGNHPVNFAFINLGMSQGPMGRFAWVKTDDGIYYCTKNGLFLFRGNAADAMRPLSDGWVEKIFQEDIDYPSATEFATGEILGVSLGWDRVHKQIIISYPKRGEQGTGVNLPVAGTPTRQLVYDTVGHRFTEWEYKLPIDALISTVGLGIIKGGEDPTDDDWIVGTHPIGNYHGANINGRLLFRLNNGYLDQDGVNSGAVLQMTGNLIPYQVSTKDMTLGGLKPKQSISKVRTVIYANNGNIKQKITYNCHNTLNEADLEYTATDEDNFLQTTTLVNRTLQNRNDSEEHAWSLMSYSYYHEEEDTWNSKLIDNIGDGPIVFVAHTFVVKFNSGSVS